MSKGKTPSYNDALDKVIEYALGIDKHDSMYSPFENQGHKRAIINTIGYCKQLKKENSK